ncbi:hypothetical protein [Streptomyces sp. DH12]|uniref:hypothetical protein n=1 Tax=Streptomyces sp. DH12 TaxID=2857010 RepID=UPI001E4BB43E|nr:hypothetical protein [Streptomyces sp. DH12]
MSASGYGGAGHQGPPNGDGPYGGWPGNPPAPPVPPVPPQGHGHPYPPPYPRPYAPVPPHGHPHPPLPPARSSRAGRLARLVYNPLYAAQRAFRPSRPGIVEDRTVRRLQLWRSLLGATAWLALTLTYSAVTSAQDAGKVAGDRLDQSWTSALVLACTFPVVVAAFVFAARGGARRVYLRRALRPLGAILALMASMATFPLAMAPETQGIRDAVGLPGKIVMGVLCLWSLGFAVYGIGLSLVHVFRTADVHELLAPVLATTLVWEMAVLDLATGAYSRIPPGVRLVFVLGAPVTVTALSCWEVYRLRHHHGMSVRRALRP